MRILVALALTLTLPSRGGNSEADAERDAKVLSAACTAMRSETGYTDDVGIIVSGTKIAINFPNRNDQFGNVARAAALAAAKEVPGKEFTVVVVEGGPVTEIPAKGYCTVSAGDGRIKGNTC